MSTEPLGSISLKDARPLQTFIAPVKVCPIPLSVLWIPLPGLPDDLGEATKLAAREIFSPISISRLSRNPGNALRYLLEGIIQSEQALNHFLLEVAGQPPDAIRFREHHEFWMRLNIGHGLGPFWVSGEHLLDIPITINRSPPSEELLGKLLSSGAIGLGAYAGLSIVPPQANPFLLLAVVSVGIICISTAAGIGRALQDGIYQRLLRLFESSSEQRQKGK